MELFILDSLFKRKTIVEDYISLVWAERFNEFGDFTVVIPSNYANKVLYKPGLFFGISKSDRIMKLETVEDAEEDGVKTLTLSGRSIEFILEHRVVWPSNAALSANPSWTISGPPKAIIDSVVSAQLSRSSWKPNNIPNLRLGVSLYPQDTIIPPVDSIAVRITTPTSLYNYIKEIAKNYSLGFRIYKGPRWDDDIYYDTYSGSDRTLGQTAVPPVVFSFDLENLKSRSILKSVEKQFYGCYVFSKYGFDEVYVNGYDASTPAGVNRSIFSIVVTEPDELTTDSQRQAYRIQKGIEALVSKQDIFVIDGEISQNSQYIYGTDYFLGDLVDMRDDTGDVKHMRVIEQIFTDDSNGEKDYPTLEAEMLFAPGTWEVLDATLTWPNAVGEWDDQIGEI